MNGRPILSVSFSSTSERGYWYGYVVISCVPHSPLLGDTYNITTRPTSISGGNYGIVGDNGQISTVTDNSSIVNEGDNIYYNPATGETGTIQDWTYDYSNRTYTLTIDTGDTTTNESGDTIAVTKQVSVTYGDENISISETNITGDTVTNNYTIYYIAEGSGHTHTWTEASTTPATCVAPGSREECCSECGESKITVVPALGHTWKLLDALVSLAEMIAGKLAAVVELVLSFFDEIPKLFGGFLDFLTALFPYLPSEITMLLTFGVVVIVFIGIIKAVRR